MTYTLVAAAALSTLIWNHAACERAAGGVRGRRDSIVGVTLPTIQSRSCRVYVPVAGLTMLALYGHAARHVIGEVLITL
jgi:hypothetical protein